MFLIYFYLKMEIIALISFFFVCFFLNSSQPTHQSFQGPFYLAGAIKLLLTCQLLFQRDWNISRLTIKYNTSDST